MLNALTRRLALLLACLAIEAAPARAQLLGPTSCSATLTPLSFGVYDPFLPTGSLSAVTITVRCNGLLNLGVPYELRLSQSAGASGPMREMRAAGSSTPLEYQVYIDPARTVVWGDGAGSSPITGAIISILSIGVDIKTAYGHVPASQSVSSGTYEDDLIVSVIF